MFEAVTAIAATGTLLGSAIVGYFRMQRQLRAEIRAVEDKLDALNLAIEHRLTMLEARDQGFIQSQDQ